MDLTPSLHVIEHWAIGNPIGLQIPVGALVDEDACAALVESGYERGDRGYADNQTNQTAEHGKQPSASQYADNIGQIYVADRNRLVRNRYGQSEIVIVNIYYPLVTRGGHTDPPTCTH